MTPILTPVKVFEFPLSKKGRRPVGCRYLDIPDAHTVLAEIDGKLKTCGCVLLGYTRFGADGVTRKWGCTPLQDLACCDAEHAMNLLYEPGALSCEVELGCDTAEEAALVLVGMVKARMAASLRPPAGGAE